MLQFSDRIQTATHPVSILGMPLTSRMTVMDTSDGVVVHSPVALTEEIREALPGPVAHLIAPNTFHHMWLREWPEAFPEADVHAPAALEGVRIDRAHDRDPWRFADLHEVHIEGFRLRETAWVFQDTAVVADLVHNIGRPTHAWTRVYTTLAGFHDQLALSRVLRWTSFSDRGAARRSVDALLEIPFSHLVVGHGEPRIGDARQALARAYEWLEAAPGANAAAAHGACG